ncbi:MAG: type II secretion system F family protein, partial [Jiangellaceae bacterium]
ALVAAAAAARVGADPSSAWVNLADDPALGTLARALAGAGTHGASPVAMLERVAADARDAARWEAQARARALGARAAAPLGLCFLPAFVLVGIVPVVAGAGPLLP